MAAEIKVGIGADVKPLEQGLKTAEKSIKAFDASASKSVEKLGASSIKAGQSLTDLNRIVQDAPFGFVAIQNNISPLIESFGRLKQESGGMGGAVKALGAALSGPAGLGLAVAAVTSGLTFLAQHPEAITNAFNTLTGATNNLNEAQTLYNGTLAESVSSVQGEISNINSLLAVARDETLSKNQRLEAVKELNSRYPELNDNIKLEGINSKETTDLVNKLNTALITKAKIQAVQELIGQEFKKQLEAQNTSLQSQAGFLDKVTAAFQLGLGPTGAFIANQTLINSGAEESNKTLDKSKQTITGLETILQQLNTELAKTGNLFVDTPKKVSKSVDTIKDKMKELKDVFSIQDQVFIKGFKTPPLDTSSLQIANDQIENHRREMKAHFQLLKEDVNNFGPALEQALGSAFSGVGEALGSALANGGNIVDALGKSLLSIVGGIATQLGQAAIGIGVAMLGIKAAFKNPFSAIAAGVALVALGSFISNSVSKIPTGGGQETSSFSPSIGSGFTPSAPGGNFGIPRQDVFIPSTVLKGNDIVISYNRTTALNGRTG